MVGGKKAMKTLSQPKQRAMEDITEAIYAQ
jgi:hypothetical protein